MQPLLPLFADPPPVAVPAPTQPRRYPRRLQHPRWRGALAPKGSIYVGRPTLWGNPFTRPNIGHARSVILYRAWLAGDVTHRMLRTMLFSEHELYSLERLRHRVLARLPMLAGLDLCCWCPLTSPWCHADVLLQAVNG